MDTPFAHYLRTNNAPSADELASIKDYLANYVRQRCSVDSDVTRLKQLLEENMQRQHNLTKAIEAHRSMASSIRRLPQDVLRRIFSYTLPKDHNAVMSVQEAPMLLGRICSSWRTIAWSTPQLWTSIHIPVCIAAASGSESSEDRLQRIVRNTDAIKEWLSRSDSCPLSISLFQEPREEWIRHVAVEFIFPSPDGFKGQIVYNLIQVLLSFSARWKKISFEAPSATLALLTKLMEADVPILESLKLESNDCGKIPAVFQFGTSGMSASESPWRAAGILKANQLHALHLSRMQGTSSMDFPVKWSHITQLCLRGHDRHTGQSLILDIPRILSVLRECPHLKTFFVKPTPPRVQSVHSSWPPLNLDSLESISISEHDAGVSLFRYLNLPSLTHLEYQGSSSVDEHMPGRELHTFLLRSNVSIGTLSLDPCSLTPEALISCLHLTPSLTKLHFGEGYFSPTYRVNPLQVDAPKNRSISLQPLNDMVLEKLTPTAGSVNARCLCPELVSVDCETGVSFSDQVLLSFLQGRSKRHLGVAKLSRVRVSFNRSESDAVQPELAAFCRQHEDLDLQLKYTPRVITRSYSPREGLPSAAYNIFASPV
ncbi:hypothetical protein BDQ17DRAFT_1272670 [Cyathus striatus]|nr:hypothetical protein BDQ17DRAFT_1272670 [Cyathus striatus]